MALRKLAVLGIVSAALGCDNVAWGGFELTLQPPPSKSDTLEAQAALEETAAEPDPSVSLGPVLFMGRREGNRLSLVPVAEVRGRNLVALPTEGEVPGFREEFVRERLTPGVSFTLFSEGVRVGTMMASGTGLSEDFCAPRPFVSGRLELVPEAAGAERFLAFSQNELNAPPYEPYQELNHDYDQRVTSLNLMAGVIPTVGATWPATILEIRRDIQVFNLEEGSPAAVVATFVYGDGLDVGPASAGAYSVFLMGTDEGDGYRTAYAAYRQSDVRGKGAPRFFDRLDWDGDGEPEILLEVMGEESMSLAAIRKLDGQWIDMFHDACGGELGGSAPAP